MIETQNATAEESEFQAFDNIKKEALRNETGTRSALVGPMV